MFIIEIVKLINLLYLWRQAFRIYYYSQLQVIVYSSAGRVK
jgi:hypothetical protein